MDIYMKLDDGGSYLQCFISATMDSPKCQHLYMDIKEIFEGYNMKVEQQVPLLWEKCPALNDALEAEKSVSRMIIWLFYADNALHTPNLFVLTFFHLRDITFLKREVYVFWRSNCQTVSF